MALLNNRLESNADGDTEQETWNLPRCSTADGASQQ
jgi:hypothetical protein